MLDGLVFGGSTVLWMMADGELVLVTATIGGSRAPGRFCLVMPCHLDASSHDLSDDDHKRKIVRFRVEPDFRPGGQSLKSNNVPFDWPALKCSGA